MAWQDDIALQRKEQQANKASKSLHLENLEAVGKSGKSVVEATSKLAKTEDVAGLTTAVNALAKAHEQLANKKVDAPVVNLNIDDKLEKLTNNVAKEIKKLDSGKHDTASLEELKKVSELLTEIQNDGISDNQLHTKAMQDLIQATKDIKLNPVINLSPTPVKVTETKLDLAPLEKTLKDYLDTKQEYTPPEPEEKGIDLSEFRAQDINDGKEKQYVGFIHPSGNWYIIENNIKQNSLRYLFGKEGYSDAFDSASSYEYSLLDEAIHALTA